MKVASVIFKEQDYRDISHNPKLLLSKIKNWLMKGLERKVEIIVLPALIGNFYATADPQTDSGYVEEILKLSLDCGEMVICPGSWWSKERQKEDCLVYHTSGLLKKGHLLLQQKQLYLARWEREFGLSRDSEVSTFQLGDFSVSVQVSTDVFYPQVSRYAALSGVNLVLAPTSIKGPRNFPRQISGLWQQVQQNSFFAVESGFKGFFKGQNFNTDSLIHAPLALTEDEDGFLRREPQVTNSEVLLVADLNLGDIKKTLSGFNPMAQLNPDFYRKDLSTLIY